MVAQPRQPVDAALELGLPGGGQPRPIRDGRRALLRQRPERLADGLQRHAGALRHLDDRHPAQDLARIAALVARRAVAADQPFRLVEMQGRDGKAAAARDIADAELARQGHLLRHRKTPLDLNLT